MSTLEHLIENTLNYIKENNNQEKYEDAIEHIKKDINFQYTNLSAEDCYEICCYVYDSCIRHNYQNAVSNFVNYVSEYVSELFCQDEDCSEDDEDD